MCINTKVTAPPTVPSKQAEELTGDEATSNKDLYSSLDFLAFSNCITFLKTDPCLHNLLSTSFSFCRCKCSMKIKPGSLAAEL